MLVKKSPYLPFQLVRKLVVSMLLPCSEATSALDTATEQGIMESLEVKPDLSLYPPASATRTVPFSMAVNNSFQRYY